jgi:CBS domain containing-hemolysin-like protein
VYDTVGGFFMSTLERIPVVGDRIELEDGTLEVQRMDGRRVDRVKFTPHPLPEGAEASDAANEAGEGR